MKRLIRAASQAPAAVLRKTLEALYPTECVQCGKERIGSTVMCRDCWAKIPLWSGAKCQRCGTPSPESCPECEHCPQRRLSNQSVERFRSATLYEGIARAGLLAMKYGKYPQMAARFADLIVQIEPPLYDWSRYAAIAHIPGHRLRVLQRGFDPAERIARRLSRAAGLPRRTRWLKRYFFTETMASLGNYRERRKALEDVFRAKLPESAKGKPLLLVDDIVTTGASAAEAARTLREAGAGPIDAVSAARAYHPTPQERKKIFEKEEELNRGAVF